MIFVPVPLLVPLVRSVGSVVIQSSSLEGEQGEGSPSGSWSRPCLVASHSHSVPTWRNLS